MRIGIDARLNAYREGGIAEYTRQLILNLPALEPAIAFIVLQHRRASGTIAPPAPNVRYIPMWTPPHHRLERITLSAEAARLNLSILHSPDFIPPRFGARHKVITVHDLHFLMFPEFQTADSQRYYAGQIRRVVAEAAHILTDAEATKAALCDRLGVAPDKITVHRLGVNPAYQPLKREAIQPVLDRLKLPDGYLLFVGTFEPRKNLTGLLDAYAALRARYPDVPPLVITGRRGWLYESIFEKVNTLHLEKQVIWLEDVSFADLPAVYNGAALLTLPSFDEGFGFPPLEAMACGIPTVVSDRGSLPEVVGNTGLLIDPDQPESLVVALHRALTDSAFRVQSSAAGLARAREFTWESTAKIVLGVYHRLLDQN